LVVILTLNEGKGKNPRIPPVPPPTPARASAVTLSRLFRLALAASLIISALFFFLWSWRWPLVGDASLMHYMSFLIERGWAPYRQIGDQQFPGSYLVEIAAMKVFGMGALAWRLFDFTLLAVASAAFFAVTKEPGASSKTVPSSRVGSVATERWLPGLFSASLFILIHGRDGLEQGGQRDLTMAVLLLTATAFLFAAVRRNSPWCSAAFALLSGLAIIIKPTTLPFTLGQVALAVLVLRHRGMPRRTHAIAAASAYCVAPAITLAFLLREHSLAAFLDGFRGVVPYYASLGHRPLTYILVHSVSPVMPLVLAWLGVLALQGRSLHPLREWERTLLAAGAVFGVVDCIIQQRGFPYYRYPLLAFLLPLIALDLDHALWPRAAAFAASLRAKSATVLAFAAVCFAGFFLAPQSAILIHRYQWRNTDFITSLQQNLDDLGGPALSDHIQCIDSIAGCYNVLYRMRLEQSTGMLADYLIFGPDTVPIIRQTRAAFSADLLAHPPQVIVVTSPLHINGPGNFQKLALWPAFADFLATRYTLQTEWTPTRPARWWSRSEIPASYRIYVLRP
jgi:hypothetical protein